MTLHRRRSTLLAVKEASRELSFVDAARIHRTLRGAFDAPGLATAVRAQFPKDGPNAFDSPAFDLLYDDDFIRVPLNLADELRAMIALLGKATEAQSELRSLQSRLKTLEMQHRNAKREAERGLLKNKMKRLEQTSRVERIASQIAQMRQSSLGLVDVGRRADLQRRRILEQIEGDPHLCNARWYGERPVVVTHHGDFLAGYLDEIDPAHLHGRTLAEIIKFGPTMA